MAYDPPTEPVALDEALEDLVALDEALDEIDVEILAGLDAQDERPDALEEVAALVGAEAEPDPPLAAPPEPLAVPEPDPTLAEPPLPEPDGDISVPPDPPLAEPPLPEPDGSVPQDPLYAEPPLPEPGTPLAEPPLRHPELDNTLESEYWGGVPLHCSSRSGRPRWQVWRI